MRDLTAGVFLGPQEELNVTMELPASLKESAMQSLEDILMERSLRYERNLSLLHNVSLPADEVVVLL